MVVRSYLTLLLLLHYLLVVGAGLVEHPPRILDRPFPYVHSAQCQLRHTLRVACFDDCNGVQYAVHKPGDAHSLTHVLAALKGLDLHCLPLPPHPLLAQPARGRRLHRGGTRPATTRRGHQGVIDSPPRWG